MQTIDEGQEPKDTVLGCVRWKDNPWIVLDEMDKLLQHFGLEIVQQDAGSDCIWHIEKRKTK